MKPPPSSPDGIYDSRWSNSEDTTERGGLGKDSNLRRQLPLQGSILGREETLIYIWVYAATRNWMKKRPLCITVPQDKQTESCPNFPISMLPFIFILSSLRCQMKLTKGKKKKRQTHHSKLHTCSKDRSKSHYYREAGNLVRPNKANDKLLRGVGGENMPEATLPYQRDQWCDNISGPPLSEKSVMWLSDWESPGDPAWLESPRQSPKPFPHLPTPWRSLCPQHRYQHQHHSQLLNPTLGYHSCFAWSPYKRWTIFGNVLLSQNH